VSERRMRPLLRYIKIIRRRYGPCGDCCCRNCDIDAFRLRLENWVRPVTLLLGKRPLQGDGCRQPGNRLLAFAGFSPPRLLGTLKEAVGREGGCGTYTPRCALVTKRPITMIERGCTDPQHWRIERRGCVTCQSMMGTEAAILMNDLADDYERVAFFLSGETFNVRSEMIIRCKLNIQK
jgi:hypothetical protein